MLLSFELSIPRNNSGNGKWSGEGECYAQIRSFRKNAPKFGYYTYNFGDGWCAGITVREVTSSCAKLLRKQSLGFCGYDWMIDSIVDYGEILNTSQRKEKANKETVK